MNRLKNISIAAVVLMIFTVQVFAQKRAFTIEDLYKIKSVGDVQISNNGKEVLFTVTKHNLKKGESNSDIFLLDLTDNKITPMTRNKAADFHPRWSSDGKNFMFLSSRKNGLQIWSMSVNGGEPEKITDFPIGISDPIWADNTHIVFSADVFPEYGADFEKNKEESDSVEKGPLQAHMADKLLYRHWTAWADGKRTHTFVFDVKSGKIKDLTPGEYNAPRFSLGGSGYAVSPDSKEICVVSNHDPDPWSSTNGDLWIISTDTGESKNITSENKAFDGSPQYSPDGKYIAFLKQTIPGYESDRIRLAVYNRNTGKIRTLTESVDSWINEFVWSPDSKSIYFTANEKGDVPLFKVDLKSGRIKKLLTDNTLRGIAISPDGKFIVTGRTSVGEPVELYKLSLRNNKLTKLTGFNDGISKEVDIRPAERIWVKGADGAMVQVFIVKPHNFDPAKKYPLIINVHGGPQSMWSDSFRGDWQVYPGSGYVVAFPNPHGSTGYGQEYTAEISGDYGGMVYEDVMKVTEALAKLSYVDEERMGIMGWSYGGYMMMWLEGHTSRFKAIAAMMGLYDLRSWYGATEELWFPEWDLKGQPWNSELYEKWSPSNFVKNFKTPCLVITGERDYRVPYTQSLQFFTALQKMNVPSRLIVFKNDGHWPNYVKSMPLYYNAHLDWFHKYLGGDPAPYDMKKMIRNRAF